MKMLTFYLLQVKKIVDLNDSNLCVVNYSQPINKVMPVEELQEHLYSIPNQPSSIPYVCSYYNQKWGFCLPHEQRINLPSGNYHAVIKSNFFDGSVDIAETKLLGSTKKEILLTSYLCHPSMANNELSGPLVLLGLHQRLSKWKKRRHTFRFVLHPETIGGLCFLHLNNKTLQNTLAGGMVVNMMGGRQENLTFKLSKHEGGIIDKAIIHLVQNGFPYQTIPFTPLSGADERHYASPGIDLPVVNASRDFHVGYPEYHTSLDNKEYMNIDKIIDSIDSLERILMVADNCISFDNLAPFGEPQLGKRNLYPTISYVDSDMSKSDERENARLELERIKMLLCYSDGKTDTIDIADKHKTCLLSFFDAINNLEEQNLIKCGKL